MQSAAQFQANPSAPGLTLVDLGLSAGMQMAGISAAWRKLVMQAEMAAPYVQLATFEGEPGTGKLTLARYLFSRSPFSGTSFQRRDAREWLLTDTICLRRQGRACCCAF